MWVKGSSEGKGWGWGRERGREEGVRRMGRKEQVYWMLIRVLKSTDRQ
jgi:hypothetical protein